MSVVLITSILGTIDVDSRCLKNMGHVLGMAQTVFSKSTWVTAVPLRSLSFYSEVDLCCICHAVEIQF